MPDVLRRGVTAGIPWTVERDTKAERDAYPKLTFAEFCAAYPRPDWDGLRYFATAETPDEYGVGFFLGVRVPDGEGKYGPDALGATWCAPGDWHRLYYDARKRVSPHLFAE